MPLVNARGTASVPNAVRPVTVVVAPADVNSTRVGVPSRLPKDSNVPVSGVGKVAELVMIDWVAENTLAVLLSGIVLPLTPVLIVLQAPPVR